MTLVSILANRVIRWRVGSLKNPQDPNPRDYVAGGDYRHDMSFDTFRLK